MGAARGCGEGAPRDDEPLAYAAPFGGNLGGRRAATRPREEMENETVRGLRGAYAAGLQRARSSLLAPEGALGVVLIALGCGSATEPTALPGTGGTGTGGTDTGGT